jgi:hypothetical protein
VLCGPDHASCDRGSIVPVCYLCISRAQALLIASNTSYLNIYRDASAFYTVSVHCSSPVNV